VKVTFGRVGGVLLVLAFMRAWRLLPEPEMRTVTFAGEGMVGVGCGLSCSVVRFSMVLRITSLTLEGSVTCKVRLSE
jgi:hypothetical protein